MPLDTTTVASVAPPIRAGGQVWVSWTPSAPGLAWQVYVGTRRAYSGTATGVWLIAPPGSTERITIGSVDVADLDTDFSASLPPAPGRRAVLSWLGGTAEGPDLVGFRVYSSASPGGAIDYSRPVATVAAFPGGIDAGAGWDAMAWDASPWDASLGSYSWESGTLENGTWTFAVVPYDAAGNETRPGQVASAAIASPPAPPAAFADGDRLRYSVLAWDQFGWDVGGWGYPEVRLDWNPSPG